MTLSIGLLEACGDVVILLMLAVAVASLRVTRLARPLLAISAFASAWLLLTATSDALQAPEWTMFTGAAVIVILGGHGYFPVRYTLKIHG